VVEEEEQKVEEEEEQQMMTHPKDMKKKIFKSPRKYTRPRLQ
jgi:hypothetical protein